MKKLLHVGCGTASLKDLPAFFQDGTWQEVRFDIDRAKKPDIIGTLLDMKAVADGSVNALYSSHNIEHVHFHEVPLVLREFKRVLSDDGFCVVRCPDIQEVAKAMAAGKLDEPLYVSPTGPISAIDIMYGHSDAIAKGEIYMAHKTGFSLKLLCDRLGEGGFAKYVGMRKAYNYELVALATKKAMRTTDIHALFTNVTGYHIGSST